MKLRFLGLTALLALSSTFIAACGGSSTSNSNTNRSNAVTNLGANNANTGAVVVNSNSSASSNSNRWNSNITREEYEKNRGEYEKEKGNSTIGSGANDMWLWVKTRASLMSADDLRDSTIDVDVVNDVVTLKGSVASAAQKARAEQVTKGIEGVKSVKNELKVAANDSMTNTGGGSSSNHANANTNKK